MELNDSNNGGNREGEEEAVEQEQFDVADEEEEDEWISSEEEEEEEEEDNNKNETIDASSLIGCTHYKRNCQIKSPCCKKFWWCRFCHNEQVQKDLLKYRGDKNRNHILCKVEEMDRYSVSEVKCMLCQHEQVLTEDNFTSCENCKTCFAKYSCWKCKFYNNCPNAKIYHCNECGLCRKGDTYNYIHCKTCEACMPKEHKCVPKSLDLNCAVCMEYLFTSTKGAISLPNCGHFIHSQCYRQMVRHGNSTCPYCNKSMFNRDQLQGHYEQLDREIAATPMPEEYRNMTFTILCNDCLGTSTVPFHLFGFKCQNCGSYNTRKK